MEQEKKERERTGNFKVKKKLKKKNLAKEDLFDDRASMVLQPQDAQNELLDFPGFNFDEELLEKNERLTEENKKITEENSRLDVEIKTRRVIKEWQADEIKRLKAQL